VGVKLNVHLEKPAARETTHLAPYSQGQPEAVPPGVNPSLNGGIRKQADSVEDADEDCGEDGDCADDRKNKLNVWN